MMSLDIHSDWNDMRTNFGYKELGAILPLMLNI